MFQVPEPSYKSKKQKEAKDPTHCQLTTKRGLKTHQKEAKSPISPATNMTTTRSQSLALSSPQAVPALQQPENPESIPVQEESLSPEWVHAITNPFSHSITSEIGQKIKKWIFYRALFDYTDLMITWNPIELAENKNLQKYDDSNCNMTHLQFNTVKQLTSLMNYMIHLIKRDRSADQRYNAYYFILDEQ